MTGGSLYFILSPASHEFECGVAQKSPFLVIRRIIRYNLCFFSPGQQVHKAKAVLACRELEVLTVNRTIILTFFFFSRIYARANFQKNFRLASVMETVSESPPEEATGLPFPPTLHTGLLIFKKFY